ncbi:restriction endonuclease subunit S [Methanogenium organophilum]|uniref:Restriction endonuclease subunit S n=1 Tax=Methanogenium organophilum TaxID=2199 RepID=A0A9X9S582_METOG|nr:restriction endonuclease subunit S [Methanogenium organophilum]WAI02309.1 restriction endonuclease subunit S [Methanogenium organophilum]
MVNTHLVPDKWNVSRIIDIVENIIDYRGRTPLKLGMEWGKGDIPALSARNVKMGRIDFEEETYYGSEDLYNRWMSNNCTKKDDIVITTEAPLGNVALIPDDSKYILSQRTILLQINPTIVFNRFLYHYFVSKQFQNILAKHSTGSTAKGIQRKKFETLEIIYPPLPEQTAIAAALSDADTLITSLDRLITKKRNIKQATMQKLLTGKKRLPGISSEWEIQELRTIVKEFIVPMRDKPKVFRGDIPWCRIEDFNGKYLDGSKSGQHVDKEIINGMNLKIHPFGTLLVSCSADLGRCAIIRKPLVTNQTFIGLVVDESKLLNEFLYYYMTFNADELNNISSGTTISYLSRELFESFKVYIPINKEEQTAIATVLSDMDTEIAELEEKRDKARMIKEGMMQELLTGRIRLV